LDFTIRSIEKLFDTYDIKAVRIVPSLYYLNVLITEIKKRQQQKNSLGYRFKIFHHMIDFWPSKPRNIKSILIQIDLITPNYTEIAQLSNETIPPERIAENLSEYCTVLLKGGHNPNEQGVDYLYVKTAF
jgi:hydroxymethylpyrimidine/phosphomethylpyrimidine kinase